MRIVGIEALNQESVLGVSNRPVLVGGGSDGATVNLADRSGLKGMMQRSLPWLHWSWCYAYRLELACKDAFKSTLYSLIEKMLFAYTIYTKDRQKSPGN